MFKFLMLSLCATAAALAVHPPPCGRNTNCNDCITDSDVCVWCAADYHENGISRCVLKNETTEDWCPRPFQRRPAASVEQGPVAEDAHRQPRKYKLKLLPGEAVNFTFSVDTSDINHPVDVYFVVDAHKWIDRTQTRNQIKEIIGALKTKTNDISFGFGTFMDKKPFCYETSEYECYSFKHRLTLIRNYEVFQQSLGRYPEADNLVFPDGGLDALAQAITCKQFGWRDESTKIVVYMSRFFIHVAGDGKQAGISKQYDGQCYTDADGVYTKELEMDYPSVDMLNKLATENNVTILFAYDDRDRRIELIKEQLSNITRITGSEVLYLQDFKHGDFTKKLKGIYELISKTIEPRVQYKGNTENKIQIIFNPDCSKDIEACKVTGRSLNFTVSVTLLRYEGLDNYSLDIAAPDLSDKLTLDIEVLKRCECESTIENNSTHLGGETRQNEISTIYEKPKNKEVSPNSIWWNIARTAHRSWRRIVKYEVYEEGSDAPRSEEDEDWGLWGATR